MKKMILMMFVLNLILLGGVASISVIASSGDSAPASEFTDVCGSQYFKPISSGSNKGVCVDDPNADFEDIFQFRDFSGNYRYICDQGYSLINATEVYTPQNYQISSSERTDWGCCKDGYYGIINTDLAQLNTGQINYSNIICCPDGTTFDQNECVDGNQRFNWEDGQIGLSVESSQTSLEILLSPFLKEKESAYGCQNLYYYCPYTTSKLDPVNIAGPSIQWIYGNYDNYIPLSESQIPYNIANGGNASTLTPLIIPPNDDDDVRCQRTCTKNNLLKDPRVTNGDWTYYCLPQIGWLEDKQSSHDDLIAKWGSILRDPLTNGGNTYSGNSTEDLFGYLCEGLRDPKGEVLATSSSLAENITSCDRIRYTFDGSGNVIEIAGFATSVELQDEYNACIKCEYTGVDTYSDKTGNLWTELGCVEPTPSGVITRIFQIAVGIAGAIIILRIIQIAIMLNTESDNPEAIAEARGHIVSIIMFILVVTMSITILRFLLQNLLQLDIPIF